MKSEAAILCALNEGPYTPHCFGFCPANHSIIMMYIHVDNKPVTLQSLLVDRTLLGVPLSKKLSCDILVDLCSALEYIHTKGFLHNDLKLDNVVLGNTVSEKFRPFIIDFGKACQSDCGRKYSLSSEQREIYKKEHSQVAPDLRDGLVVQSHLTDIYSFGRIVKRVNSIIIHSSSLQAFCKQIMNYHSSERPTHQLIKEVLCNLNL